MNKVFLGFWNRSVILTYIELCIAVGSICMSADGNVIMAVLGIVLCGICDMFDGKIARATKRTEDACVFGIQIDSLCDLVSFGVLPSAIGHAVGVQGAGILILMFYTLAAVIRLGYFNVSEQNRQKETKENRKEFEGLPVTSSAILVPLTWLLVRNMENAAVIYAGMLLVTGFLFISRIRVKKPQL